MSKRKPPPAQLSREDKLKILKKAKLYTGSTKITGNKASGAQKRILAKFKNDIPLLASGKAKAISIGKTKPKNFSKDINTANGRAVVHVEPGEKPRFNKKKGTITSIVVSHGVRYRRIIFPNETAMIEYKPTSRTRYVVPFRQWGIADSPLFSDLDELKRFMADYEGKGFKNWLDVVEVLELEGNGDDEELEDA